jgi:hypothetical protein
MPISTFGPGWQAHPSLTEKPTVFIINVAPSDAAQVIKGH